VAPFSTRPSGRFEPNAGAAADYYGSCQVSSGSQKTSSLASMESRRRRHFPLGRQALSELVSAPITFACSMITPATCRDD
jgi:hypothetical protein